MVEFPEVMHAEIASRHIILDAELQARNLRGAIGNPPPNFLKTYVFTRYSNKLDHFAHPLPSISVGCHPAEFYTTCPGERVLTVTRFKVTFVPLRLCYEDTCTCSSKDAENLTTYAYVLWCSQIICIRPYSLNTVIVFHSVNELSNFAVSVWLMACYATMFSHFT